MSFVPPRFGKGGNASANMSKGQVKRPMEDNAFLAKKAKVGGAANGAESTLVGEVRFQTADSAQVALQLAGSSLGGSEIEISMDEKSKDMTRVIVTNLAAGAKWQDLKDYFAQCGTVAFADVKSAAPRSAEIRMGTAEEAQQAIAMLDGTSLGGGIITVKPHPASKDDTKLQVLGVSHEITWQDLKDQFAQAGTVAFADVKNMTLQPGIKLEGEVRYEDPANTQQALTSLNGSFIGDTQIFLEIDAKCAERSKLIVNGLTPGIQWQELKDHFAPFGTVAFAQIHTKDFGKGMAKGFGGLGRAVFGGKGSKFGAAGQRGEVRFDTATQAQMAVAMLNGSILNGASIQVDWDWKSPDGTKLWVGGIPPGTRWQDLKDHFASAGRVAFADIKQGKGGA